MLALNYTNIYISYADLPTFLRDVNGNNVFLFFASKHLESGKKIMVHKTRLVQRKLIPQNKLINHSPSTIISKSYTSKITD